jgi:hypothetical protein
MNDPTTLTTLTRRALLRRFALLGLGGAALTQAATDPPLLSEDDPAAKAVHYVEDAQRAPQAQSGANCSNCSIYSARSASEGSCTLFKDRRVKAAGWCNAWTGL